MADSHLISVDELRAAGALDVPPEWRKSLSAGTEKLDSQKERNLFSDLLDDDDGIPADQQTTACEPDDDVSAADVS